MSDCEPAALRILRLCSVFMPPAVSLSGRGDGFDLLGGMQNHTFELTRALDEISTCGSPASNSSWTWGLQMRSPGAWGEQRSTRLGSVLFHRAADDLLVRAAHALDLCVYPYTVNEISEMCRLIDLGVDGVVTDLPDRLYSLLRSRTRSAPVAASL